MIKEKSVKTIILFASVNKIFGIVFQFSCQFNQNQIQFFMWLLVISFLKNWMHNRVLNADINKEIEINNIWNLNNKIQIKREFFYLEKI